MKPAAFYIVRSGPESIINVGKFMLTVKKTPGRRTNDAPVHDESSPWSVPSRRLTQKSSWATKMLEPYWEASVYFPQNTHPR